MLWMESVFSVKYQSAKMAANETAKSAVDTK